jgi:hypothetical protein
MLTQERVKSLFDYRDGTLYWRRSRGTAKAESEAGSVGSSHGYMATRFDGKLHLNHRLIFLYHNGYMPENNVDHIDRNKLNNNINNLREVSQSCNMRNSSQPITNRSKVKGVHWCNRDSRWVAQITKGKTRVRLGSFTDFAEVVAYRLASEQCLNWVSCDANSPAYNYIRGSHHA